MLVDTLPFHHSLPVGPLTMTTRQHTDALRIHCIGHTIPQRPGDRPSRSEYPGLPNEPRSNRADTRTLRAKVAPPQASGR